MTGRTVNQGGHDIPTYELIRFSAYRLNPDTIEIEISMNELGTHAGPVIHLGCSLEQAELLSRQLLAATLSLPPPTG